MDTILLSANLAIVAGIIIYFASKLFTEKNIVLTLITTSICFILTREYIEFKNGDSLISHGWEFISKMKDKPKTDNENTVDAHLQKNTVIAIIKNHDLKTYKKFREIAKENISDPATMKKILNEKIENYTRSRIKHASNDAVKFHLHTLKGMAIYLMKNDPTSCIFIPHPSQYFNHRKSQASKYIKRTTNKSMKYIIDSSYSLNRNNASCTVPTNFRKKIASKMIETDPDLVTKLLSMKNNLNSKNAIHLCKFIISTYTIVENIGDSGLCHFRNKYASGSTTEKIEF